MITFIFFFFNDTATTEIYTLSLHDALPSSSHRTASGPALRRRTVVLSSSRPLDERCPQGCGHSARERSATATPGPLVGGGDTRSRRADTPRSRPRGGSRVDDGRARAAR